MKFLFYLAILGWGLGNAGALQAQSPEASDKMALPAGPWPKRAPAMSAWTVTITQVDPASATSPSNASPAPKSSPPRQITVTKTWPVVHEVETDEKGQTWDKWYENRTEIVAVPNTDLYTISKSKSVDGFLFQDYATSDFDRFDWLRKTNYQGIAESQGRKCFYFQALMALHSDGTATLIDPGTTGGSNPPPGTRGGPIGTVTVKAYLDVATLLPVEMDWGSETRIFQFGPAPQAVQSLPEKMIAYVRKKELEEKKARTPVAPP